MADQAINALPTKTSPTTGDKMLMIGAAEEYQIDYDQLATAILNKLTSKTFTLDQGTKTLVAALNELNSKSDNKIQFNEIEVSIDTKINEIYSTNGAIDISNAFPSAKRIIALGGRSPGSNYVCNATVEGNAVLYCNAKYSGSYKVLLIGIY